MLYLLTIAPAKAWGHREFDISAPRDLGLYDHPVRKRALGAHVNGIETFPFLRLRCSSPDSGIRRKCGWMGWQLGPWSAGSPSSQPRV